MTKASLFQFSLWPGLTQPMYWLSLNISRHLEKEKATPAAIRKSEAIQKLRRITLKNYSRCQNSSANSKRKFKPQKTRKTRRNYAHIRKFVRLSERKEMLLINKLALLSEAKRAAYSRGAIRALEHFLKVK